MSTLIREIIDEGIVKLAKEHLVVAEEAGMIHQFTPDGEKHNIRFFTDIVDHVAPELNVRIKRDDFESDKAFDKALYEEIKLGYEYGFSFTDSWVNPDDGDDDVLRTFTKKTKVEE
jgi:predicted SnoaL-like aldol condensation-catalyzing enzyme